MKDKKSQIDSVKSELRDKNLDKQRQSWTKTNADMQTYNTNTEDVDWELVMHCYHPGL